MSNTLTNPHGESIVFRQTAADTDGRLLEMEATWAPHRPAPPRHFHPCQTETFEVVEGALRVWIHGHERDYGPGERFVVPSGTPHAMHAAGDRPARARWCVEPALGTERFFRAVWARSYHTAPTPRRVLRLATMLDAARAEYRLWGPPQWLQRVVLGVLAPLGRRFARA